MMWKVGHAAIVRMGYEGIAVRMTPIRAMVVRMVMHKPRIPHSSRPVRDVGTIVPIRTKRALVIGDGWIQGSLERRSHGPTERSVVHLVRQKRLQWRYLVEHRVDLRQVLARETRSSLEVAADAPFRHFLRVPSLGVVKAW